MKKIILVLLILLSSCTKKQEIVETDVVDVKETAAVVEKKVIGHIDVDKQETVYASADAYGNIDKVDVDVILRAGDLKTIEDISDLSNIRNTQSDERFTVDGNRLSFENKNEDIHYKGSSDKNLPIEVKISYFLDGKNVSIEEIKGKSGKVKIRFDYKNTTNVLKDGYELIEPFMAISIIPLDGEVFSNVKIDNGKLLSYGDTKMAIIYALPGLQDVLKLSDYELTKDIKLSSYGELEADVNNFSLEYTATVLSNGLFKDVKEDDLNDINKFARDTIDFKDDTKELTDNTGKLLDACISMQDGLNSYTSAISKLNTNMDSLIDGAQKLTDGLNELSGLSKQTLVTFESLSSWLENYQNILGIVYEMNMTVESMQDSDEKTKLLSSLEQLNNELSTLKIDDYQKLAQEIGKIIVYIDGIHNQEGIEDVAGLKDASELLKKYLKDVKTATEGLVNAGCQLNLGAKQLVKAAREFDDGMNDFVQNDIDDITKLGGSKLIDISNKIKALKKIDESYRCFTGLLEGKTGETTFLIETTGTE